MSHIERKTTRRVEVSLSIRLQAAYRADGAEFMPDRVIETLQEFGGDRRATYNVEVRGPIVLKSGRLHASQSGMRSWSASSWGGSKLENIPAEIAAHLVGEHELRTGSVNELEGRVD